MEAIEIPKVDNFGGFVSITNCEKKILLKALGYDVNGIGTVVDEKTKRPIWCRYTNKPVKFSEASILPGSDIVINTTPISISNYIEEFLEDA